LIGSTKAKCKTRPRDALQFQTGDAGALGIFSKKLMADAIGTSTLPSKALSQDSVALIFSVNDVDEFYKKLISSGAQGFN